MLVWGFWASHVPHKRPLVTLGNTIEWEVIIVLPISRNTIPPLELALRECTHGRQKKVNQTDQFGGLIDIHANIDSGSVFHTLSLTSGYMWGDHTYMGFKCFREIVPVLAGYTLNLPLSEKANFYLGGKAGIAWSYADIKGSSRYAVSTPGGQVASGGYSGVLWSDSGTAFTYSISAGLTFSINEQTDFKIGYEMFSFRGLDPFHAVEVGVSWNF